MNDFEQPNKASAQEKALTPELTGQLESKGIKVVDEYPKVIYCEGDVVNFDFLKTGIRKPVVFVQSRNRGEMVTGNRSISDALDSISKLNFYRDSLGKHQINFSRALIAVGRKMGSNMALDGLGLDEDQKAKLKEDLVMSAHIPINFGGATRPGQLENAIVYVRNIREDLESRIQLFNLLENFCIFIESGEAKFFDPQKLTADFDKRISESLHDPENFRQIVKNNPFFSIFIESVEKQGIKWEDFCQLLFDYYTNYFPAKFEEMAQLQDEVNRWLQSLKPEALEKGK